MGLEGIGMAVFGKRKVTPAIEVAPEPSAPKVEPVKMAVVPPQATAVVAEPVQAYVFTRSTRLPSLVRVLSRAREIRPEIPMLELVDNGDGSSLMVRSDRTDTAAASMFLATQFPLQELQPMMEQCRDWQTRASDLKGHRSHAIVSATHSDPAIAHLILTGLTAAMIEETNASGVYWANSGNLMGTGAFLLRALEERRDQVMTLWANVETLSTTYRPGCVLAKTVGLGAFGLPEYECVCTQDELAEKMFDFMFGLAIGAMKTREQREDGSFQDLGTGGSGRSYELTFHHLPSTRDGKTPVVRVEIYRG